MKGTRPTGSRWWNHATQLGSNTYDAWEEIFVWGFHRVDANNDVLADACRPLDQRVRSKGNSACIGWRLIPKVERLQPPASVAKKLIPPN